MRQGVDEVEPFAVPCRVARVDQNVAAHIHVLADLRQHFAAGRDVVGRQIGAAQPQIAGVAVGEDLHRAHALVAAQIIGNLLQTVFAGIQLHHLGAGGDALEQVGGVFDPGVDEHYGLPRNGNRRRCGRRVGLPMGVFAGGGVLGRRRLGGRVGSGMAVRLGGIGHSGGHRAVKQHARFQEHDHRRRQGVGACCCLPCLTFAPPHAAHPFVEC